MALTTMQVDLGLRAAFAQLESRQAIRLHPRRGPVDPHGSRGGGPIWHGSAGPRRCEEHDELLVPVIQLLRTDLPELGWPDDADVLQVLWCPIADDESDYQPVVSLAWEQAASLTSVVAVDVGEVSWDDPRCGYLPQPCQLSPEVVVEHTGVMFLPVEMTEELDAYCLQRLRELERHGLVPPLNEYAACYQYNWSLAPGWKLGGWPQGVHWREEQVCAGCGERMEHLQSIGCDEADGGSWWRWAPLEERHLWIDTNAWKQRGLAQNGHNLRVGRDGSLAVMICYRCDGWPIQQSLQ